MLSPKKLVQKFSPAAGLPLSRFGLPAPTLLHDAEALAKTRSTLGRVGSLEVRLARSAGEVKKAQRLRYEVFYEEMSAIADAQTLTSQRDSDPFDSICDHLLVIDHAKMKRNKLGRLKPTIVGTYRLLRQDVAGAHGGFYSASEYDVQSLVDANPGKRFLELGRSCVLKPYRSKKTVELLWQGIWAYVLAHKIDVMIGCASFENTNPDLLAEPLSFLHHHARAPEDWRVSALPERHVEMNRVPAELLDQKAALRQLPPLVKGYLRLGAYIGEGAVIDHQFGTTDVMIIMPVSELNARYVNYYGADASRFAS
ncbi:GNAT family N-acetyltransferase [Roseibium limicola]|uniref:L-ornithine N(alpha)-acyltransferase n=1 Tax=Roseibium limicola TaxID=2816037 RepID=A0A939JB92_9HYPH|nr:GNAT family N-acetyltransferase [Roseibium limicola]MBO0347213.1 GNAT family N-acetyltransferase [Roseibium limicola]